MTSRSRISANYTGWIIIALAIILLYFSYFFIYIPRQESFLKQRSFRILKEYAGNVHDKYGYYQKHLENYDVFYNLRLIHNHESPEGSNSHAVPTDPKIKSIHDVIESLNKKIITETRKVIKAKTIEEDTIKKETILIDKKGNKHYLLFQSKVNYPSEIILDFKLEEYLHNNVPHFIGKKFIHKVPFNTLMEGLKFDQLLENIVLFDKNGVIYNSKQDIVHDITSLDTLIHMTEYVQGGVFESITVRAEKKHLIILPIDFLGEEYYLAGFITDRDYKKKTRTINSQLLIIVSGILLLILIGMPVLKIIFISRMERLHASDATGGIMSMILGVSLLILIVISTLKHYIVDRDELEKRIDQISNVIYGNFTADLNTVFDFYEDIINTTNKSDSDLPAFVSRSFSSDKKYELIPEKFYGDPIPLNEIILIQANGIISKAVTQSAFSDIMPIDLSERLYFKNAMDESKAWLSRDKNEKFYIESIKSYNTGYQEAAVSFHLSDSIAGKLNAPVIAITSAIPSLYEQVLPKDIEYVVINETGRVLFHSQQTKNLHENFFDECNFDPRLLGSIKQRVTETLHITYNEEKWLARIIPVENTPLYYITLLDLKQTHDKNARIILFTFYLLIATFICIFIGMQIMQQLNRHNSSLSNGSWSLSWLLFHADNFGNYKKLLVVQLILFICQVVGVLIIETPVTMFIYQLIFIGYSGFIALVVLGDRERPVVNFLKFSHVSSSLILIIVSVLNLSLFLLQPGWVLALSISVLLMILVLTELILRYDSKVDNEESKLKRNLISDHVPIEIQTEKNSGKDTVTQPQSISVRNTYYAFMLLWLISLTAVPVILFYRTVKLQEEKLWQLNQMQFMAEQNLSLSNKFKKLKQGNWYKQARGNGIDNLTINDCSFSDFKKEDPKLQPPDKIYMQFPDMVTSNDYPITLLQNESRHQEWKSDASTLYYSRAGTDGCVKEVSKGMEKMEAGQWLIYLCIPILLVAFFIWILFRYLSDHLLNTLQATWMTPEPVSWKQIVQDKTIDRLMLNSVNTSHYLSQTKELFEPKRSSGTSVKRIQKSPVEVFEASQLLVEKFEFASATYVKGKIIWIDGIAEFAHESKAMETIFHLLMKLNQKAKGKVIVALPFEFDFLDELYENYMENTEAEKEMRVQTYTLIKKWENTFKDYYKFLGKVNLSFEEELKACLQGHAEQVKAKKIQEDKNTKIGIHGHLEIQYRHIWSNLSSMEKLILYDLADDGILNLKNKSLVDRLALKGLITLKPFPKLFSENFQYYIKHAVNVEEAKSIERKFSRRGKWKNMRYLILIILIPLAAFLFIAQGSSIEKVIGIFTGILAVFTGMMRLFDSGIIRQTPQ